MLHAALLTVFPVLVSFAGVSDMLTMTIPNRVSLVLCGAFVVLATLVGLPLEAWGWHLLGAFVVFIPCFTMFALGWMGGGDAKISSSIALWIGFGPQLLGFGLLVAIYGMILTVVLLGFRYACPVLPAMLERQDWISRLHHRKTGIPYGIAIAAAALQIYPQTDWFSWLALG